MNPTILLLLLLLLACPLSMIVMHRGMGHSHGSRDDSERLADPDARPGEDEAPRASAHGGCGHSSHGGATHDHGKSSTAA